MKCLDLLHFTAFLLMQTGINSQSHSCPLFGDDRQDTDWQSEHTRLFMNFDTPAQCSGTVTQWNFCYQRRGSAGDTLGVKFLVYREINQTGVYNVVPGSTYTLTLEYADLDERGCRSQMLNPSQSFQILPNDIISACIIRTDDIMPLHVTRHSLIDAYQFNVAEDCNSEELSTIDIDEPGIRIRWTRDRLQVNAVISSDISCRVGHNPSKSRQFIRSWTFLNREFPAKCDGRLTAWNYCYYRGGLRNLERTYTASVAVWRFDNVTQQFIVVEDSVRRLELQHVDRSIDADLYCRQELLTPENYVQIRQGDIVGVLLPSTDPIPMIGASNRDNYVIWRDDTSVSAPSNISLDSVTSEFRSIHLYADITIEITTTSIEKGTTPGIPLESSPGVTLEITAASSIDTGTSPGTSTGTGTSDQPQPPGSGGLSGGGVAAIVVTIIVLLLVVAGVAAVIAVGVRTKRVTESSGGLTHPDKPDVVGVAFDNINYSNLAQHEPPTGLHSQTKKPYQPPPSPYLDPQASAYQSQSIEYESIEFRTHSGTSTESNLYASIHPVPRYEDIIEQNRSQDIYAGLDPYQVPAQHEEQLYSQIETHPYVATDIAREDLNFVQFLGSGQFGNVEEGIWEAESGNVPVAMKTLKEGSSAKEKVRFLQEAVTMAQFRHPNVVVMYGMVTEGEPIILVVELIDKGDLRKNLLDMRPDPGELTIPDLPQLLLKYSQHVALGMHYLSSKGFVHRDLAARNVLLSKNNICKIADFGLSRELEDENYYTSSGGLVPVKWTAPEAIRFRKYSTASDVWSYGCVLYEIWSLGHKPFEKQENMELIHVLESGKRLAPPTGCPKAVYHLMIKCWHPTGSHRPSFRDAIITLTEKAVRVLEIPQAALDLNPQFKHLGGPLEVGEKIYMSLQTTYV